MLVGADGPRRPTIEVGILGPLSLRGPGGDLTPSSPRLRQLVGLLAAAPGAAVRTERLTAELWPDGTCTQPQRSIQTYVWQLRRRLETPDSRDRSPVRHAARVGYSFDLGSVDVDVSHVQQWREEGEAAAASGDLDAAADLFGKAMELCRGPALDGVPIGPVLDVHRRGLDGLRLAVLQRGLQTLQDLGRYEQVIAHFDRVMQEEVSHEQLYAHLLAAFARLGQRSTALDLYHWVRRTGIEKTGLEPGPVLRDVADALLADDVAPASRAPASAPRPAPWSGADRPAGSSAVRDRDRPWTVVHEVPPPAHLDRVDPDALERVVARLAVQPGPTDHRVVRVAGPPRSGRTSLCRAAAARLASSFPDGTLHLDLTDLDVRQATTRLLQAVTGGQIAVPNATADRARLWRQVSDRRRVLLVVEAITDPTTVATFVPGSGTGALLVSSRSAAPIEAVTSTVVLDVPADVDARDEDTVRSVRRSLADLDPRAGRILRSAARRSGTVRRVSLLMAAAHLELPVPAASAVLDELVHFGFARNSVDARGHQWYELAAALLPTVAEVDRRDEAADDEG